MTIARKHDDKLAVIDDFATEAGGSICALSGVSDYSLAQFNAYLKFKKDDLHGVRHSIRFSMMGLCIELLLTEVGDTLKWDELPYLELRVIEAVSLTLAAEDTDAADETATAKSSALRFNALESVIHQAHANSLALEDMSQTIVAKTYLRKAYRKSLRLNMANQIPEDFLSRYISEKVDLFEEQDFRGKLVRKLNRAAAS